MKFFRFLSLIAMAAVMALATFFLPPSTLSVTPGLLVGLALTLAVMMLARSLALRHLRQADKAHRMILRAAMFSAPASLCPD